MFIQKPVFEFYTRPNGHNEFVEFFNKLPLKDQQKVSATIANIEQEGITFAIKTQIVKKINDNIYEIRSKFGNNIQRILYFHVVESRFIITHGFTKKTQKTPRKEINRAMSIREEFFKEERIRNDNHKI